MTSKIIRDFIYVDAEKLASFYAQIFGGIEQLVISQSAASSQTTDTQTSSPLTGGKSIQDQIINATQYTQNKILHDYLYTRLEEKLDTSIIQGDQLSPQNYQERLANAFLVQVRGYMRVEDYTRFQEITRNLDMLEQFAVYAAIQSNPQHKSELQTLLAEYDRVPGSQKKMVQKKIDKFKAEIAKPTAFSELTDAFGMIQKVIGLFYNGIDLIIMPPDSQMSFRGIINTQWLRVKPDLLRTLYNRFFETTWVMVGQTTYLPQSEDAQEQKKPLSDLQVTKGMQLRDVFLPFFQAVNNFDGMFSGRTSTYEFGICPLAIYRETSISVD